MTEIRAGVDFFIVASVKYIQNVQVALKSKLNINLQYSTCAGLTGDSPVAQNTGTEPGIL